MKTVPRHAALVNIMTEDMGSGSSAPEIAPEQLSASVRRAVDLLLREGIPYSLRKLPGPNLPSEEIALACGTELQAIVRVLLYKGKTSKKPVLLLASATTVVNERLLAELVGEVLEKSDPAFALRITGYTQNAMPPAGHYTRVPIMLDDHITRLARFWCHAGEPDVMMSAPTMTLARAIAARVVRVS